MTPIGRAASSSTGMTAASSWRCATTTGSWSSWSSARSGFMVWSEPFVSLRIPKIFNLRTDPFERADTDANNYERWWIERVFALVPAQTFVGEYIETFKEFPPRQKPAKFNVDDALEPLQNPGGN